MCFFAPNESGGEEKSWREGFEMRPAVFLRERAVKVHLVPFPSDFRPIITSLTEQQSEEPSLSM